MRNRWAMVMLAVCLGSATLLHAKSTAEDFEAYKQYAHSLGATPINAMKNFHPETTFKDYTTTPIEQSHYPTQGETRVDLKGAAMAALINDIAGQTVYDAFGKKPVFDINASADAIQQAKKIEANSGAITQGKSNGDVNCDGTPQPACTPTFHEETCAMSRSIPSDLTCVNTLNISVQRETVNQRVKIEFYAQSKLASDNRITVNLLTGDITNANNQIIAGSVSAPIKLTHACLQMSSVLHSIQSGSAEREPSNVVGLPSCSNGGRLTASLGRTSAGLHKITIDLTVQAESEPFDQTEAWENGCNALDAQSKEGACQVNQASHCTSLDKTRIINGVSFTRDCWETQTSYTCMSPLPAVDTCEPLRQKGCQNIGSRCASMTGALCTQYEQRYQCPEKVCPPAIVCMHDVFCADGSCVSDASTQNTNFGKNVAALATVAEAGHERGEGQVTLFAGHATSCNIHDFGLLDCCSDKGWGKKLNLAHCSEEDRDLGQAKLDYLVHYIGKYCAKEWPAPAKGCEKWKHTYCVFDSKMARIVQEEGRLKQLNANALGSPESPNCSGLSVDELQRLKMGEIDFVSPVYPFVGGKPLPAAGIAGDIHPDVPNTDKSLDAIQQRMQQKAGKS